MLLLKEQANGELINLATGAPTAAAGLSAPALVLSPCSTFNLVWWGTEMHGPCPSVQVHRPQPSDPSVFIIGDAAVYGSNPPTGSAVTVKAINDPDNTLLQPAEGWFQVWNDQGSGGSNDGSIWAPVAPDGFVGIGAVANGGYDPPSIPNYRCLNVSVLMEASSGLVPIWSDQGSHAHEDVAFWAIPGVTNAFVTSGAYGIPPVGGAYGFKAGLTR